MHGTALLHITLYCTFAHCPCAFCSTTAKGIMSSFTLEQGLTIINDENQEIVELNVGGKTFMMTHQSVQCSKFKH
jgi:hypothetical protein